MEDRTKVEIACHECESCGKWLYKGTSQKNYEALCEKYPDKNIERGRLDIDHVHTVIPIEKGWKFTYDEYIERLFCGSELLQGLCKECHKEKSEKENILRRSLTES